MSDQYEVESTEQNGPNVDDQRLEDAQIVRHDIVNALMTDGKGSRVAPTDKDSVYMILTALKDSDGSIYKKKRLVVDEVNAESDRVAAETLTRMFGSDVAKRQPAGGGHGAPIAPRAIGEKLPDFQIQATVSEPVGTPVDLGAIRTEGRRIFKGEVAENTDGGQSPAG